MSARSVLFIVALGAAGVAVAATPSAHEELQLDATGEVQIAPDAHVSDYRLDAGSKLPPKVAALLDHDIRSWQFEPVLVNGTAVIAKTAVHLSLMARPAAADGEYTITIGNVGFGDPKRFSGNEPPRYPEDAARARLGARVLLSLRLDDSGKVIEALPYQTSLGARTRSENEAEHWRKMFERASVRAAKTWRFDLTETINGKPIGTTAIAPIVYSIRDPAAPTTNQWTAYVPGPVHPPSSPKATPTAHAAGALTTLADGQTQSLDSHFKLKNDVIGKTL